MHINEFIYAPFAHQCQNQFIHMHIYIYIYASIYMYNIYGPRCYYAINSQVPKHIQEKHFMSLIVEG